MPKRTDKNQVEIVETLRRVGLSVAVTSGVGCGFPDLVIGGVMPCMCGSGRRVRQTKIVEVKTTSGILTPDQEEFHAAWRGQLDIARSPDEVLRMTGSL
jgi:hypothetical protein